MFSNRGSNYLKVKATVISSQTARLGTVSGSLTLFLWGTDPRMSGTAQPKGLAAWPDRSCFGRSEKLGGVYRNSLRGSREEMVVVGAIFKTKNRF